MLSNNLKCYQIKWNVMLRTFRIRHSLFCWGCVFVHTTQLSVWGQKSGASAWAVLRYGWTNFGRQVRDEVCVLFDLQSMKLLLLNCRNSPDCLIGYDDNFVLEHCLLESDLTSLISQGKRGGLLRQVGHLIQVEAQPQAEEKYEASVVQLSNSIWLGQNCEFESWFPVL